jgi:superoxide dismutase, Cu-Zn family
MNSKFKTLSVLVVALAMGFAGCNRETNTQARTTAATPTHPPSASELRAVAQLQPTQGNNVRGTVRFLDEGGKVRVIAEIAGLTPGEHGFHVHENGDCSAPDASSAGGHFNPTNQPHAARDAEARHIGDLGNLTADANGRAQLDYVDPKLTLNGPNSIVGRAVIVHAGRDDLRSQPSGDSGARVACGTIELERKNF